MNSALLMELLAHCMSSSLYLILFIWYITNSSKLANAWQIFDPSYPGILYISSWFSNHIPSNPNLQSSRLNIVTISPTLLPGEITFLFFVYYPLFFLLHNVSRPPPSSLFTSRAIKVYINQTFLPLLFSNLFRLFQPILLSRSSMRRSHLAKPVLPSVLNKFTFELR